MFSCHEKILFSVFQPTKVSSHYKFFQRTPQKYGYSEKQQSPVPPLLVFPRRKGGIEGNPGRGFNSLSKRTTCPVSQFFQIQDILLPPDVAGMKKDNPRPRVFWRGENNIRLEPVIPQLRPLLERHGSESLFWKT